MDELDLTQHRIELELEAALKKIAPVDTHNPEGVCLNCGEETGTDKRWCDYDCCTDWELRQRRSCHD
jgi:hypothetical protein